MNGKHLASISKIAATMLMLLCAVSLFAQTPLPRGTGQPRTPAENYTIEQSVSEKAQLHTLSFSALAFMTGTYGADTFLPPGKVADYFGFQYMRDIDTSEAGHNMMFLTNILNNMLSIFNADQKAMFLALAREQEGIYRQIAEKRLVLIMAFRANLEGKITSGYKALSETAVKNFVAEIFDLDGTLSFRRAEVYGTIVKSLLPAQVAAIKKLAFNDSSTWKEMPDQTDKKSMTHEQDVLYSTYASEFFSWYTGSMDADVYFCPERHGTYFGGFYMKDYPAIGHSDYFIPIDLTGNAGESLLAMLTDSQRSQITGIMEPLKAMLAEILTIRRTISTEFRKYLSGGTADKALVMKLSHRYGELDGALSYLYASRFAAVYKTLTQAQKEAMVKLRNQSVFPDGVYIYADPIKTPTAPDISILFSK